MKLGWGILMIKYKSYGKLSKEFYGVRGSFFNKPYGSLWSCAKNAYNELIHNNKDLNKYYGKIRKRMQSQNSKLFC